MIICDLADIPDPGSRAFVVDGPNGPLAIFLVRRGGEVFGYVNSCPHIGAPLDWESGQFLDVERTHIICANHGALFEIGTGYCIAGPCSGKALSPYPISIVGTKVHPADPGPKI